MTKNCQYDGCTIQPKYNLSGEKKKLYCKLHKLENMIDITHTKCQHDNCKTRANFNLPDKSS